MYQFSGNNTLPRPVDLNLFELATHFFGLKNLRHTCLIKRKILVLLVIIDEISIILHAI